MNICLLFGVGGTLIHVRFEFIGGSASDQRSPKNMKTDTPIETRYTHDFPSHYRAVIHKLETELAVARHALSQIADTYLEVDDGAAAHRMRSIARARFVNHDEGGAL